MHVCMYVRMDVCTRGGPIRPLHRDLQWSIVLYTQVNKKKIRNHSTVLYTQVNKKKIRNHLNHIQKLLSP
jgi:hypothetical protein